MTGQSLLLEEGHQRLIKARHGYVLYNRNDTVIGRSIEMYGEYFESEVKVFRRFVGAGDVALDVGANIGTHTLALARLTGPRGFVYAFEPQRLVFQTLCANVALNSLTNVHCVNAAVGETPGMLRMSDPDPDQANNFGGAQVEMLAGAPQAPPVARVALDDFLDVGGLKLVKIDVEGMEAQVLRGARRTLDRFRPLLYVENAFADKSPELVSVLQEAGYRSYWHFAPFFARDNFFGCADPLFPMAFVDRGDEFLDAIGFAMNLVCIHESLSATIEGLRPLTDRGEHPFRRECVHLFGGGLPNGVPILKGL
ncbi:MAG: FkbM family methyltransferase [Chromatiales bacterium]|nr:FkbM family methyltransferase [Chromatiales bacterium]